MRSGFCKRCQSIKTKSGVIIYNPDFLEKKIFKIKRDRELNMCNSDNLRGTLPPFKTEIHPDPASSKIDHSSKMIALGSCFTEAIGQKLKSCKFKIQINPFGTLFNPASIFTLLKLTLHSPRPFPEGIVSRDGHFCHLLCHSDVSAPSPEVLQDLLEKKCLGLKKNLGMTDLLILTFGNAQVFVHKELNGTVANCHKQPADFFTKRMLTPEEIVYGFEEVYLPLKLLNPGLGILLTLSPVRYLSDGFCRNSVSKSVLRFAIDLIQKKFPDVDYFPAYEIFMDDLRDYRFYADDLVHPASLAVEYVWTKFSDSFFGTETRDIIRKWTKLIKSLEHNPVHPQTHDYQKFIHLLLRQIEPFSRYFNVDEEIRILKQKIEPQGA